MPAATGTAHYRLCGALQALIFMGCAFAAAIGLSIGAGWMAAGGDAADIYLSSISLVFGAAILAVTGMLPVAAKWVLVGRFRRQRIRAWSFAYLRFWIVKTLAIANPVAHLIVGTPLYSLYLRAMGAQVGRRALILTHHLPVCTDLISVGDDAVIRKETYLNGYRARSGLIEMGPVAIGSRAFVGQGTVLDIDTAVGDDAEIAHASSLQAGRAVPAGEVWHGSPAEPAPSGSRYRTVPASRMPSWPPAVYGAGRLIGLLAVVGPLEAAVATVLFTPQGNRLGPAFEPLLAAAAIGAALLAAMVGTIAVPRLLARALVPGTVYPLYGFRYALERAVERFSSNPLLTGLFGDSSAIPHYLRLTGWRLDPFEQTGSNFGMDVKQDVPGLCAAGTGTMVSDGLSMMNTEFSSTAFRVMPSAIGNRNFLGNAIHYPPGSRAGDNCLLATKVMVPTSGPPLENVGLLGSPAFEIPRTVQRDRQFHDLAAGPERDRRLRAKLRHNLVTMGLHLLLGYLLLLGVFEIEDLAAGLSSRVWPTAAALPVPLVFVVALLMFAVALFVLAERAVLGFRSLRPRSCSIYDPYFWSHERYWKLSSTAYLRMFDGTPFKTLVWRLLGVRIGRRIFDDGMRIAEKTLVDIGDESTFNMGVNLQAHSLEEGTFKSDRISIGASCTVGTVALINYGVTLEDRSIVEADSFVMKGSRIEAGRRWRGNPATELQPEAV
jgi:non-ribosomal peptide synthetase-like protein